jgi:hypothetical protein
MSASVTRQGSVLEVVLEAERVPNRQALTAFVQKGIHNLSIQSIQSIRILGQQIGVGYPAWMQELQLDGVTGDQATSATTDLSSSLATPLNIQSETAPETEASDLSRSTDLDSSAKEASVADVTGSGIAETGAEPSANLPEPNSDQGLLDFLNDLSLGGTREDFPAEAVQEQSVFADSSAASLDSFDSSTWIDSTNLSEQPDDDLLDFLNQSDPNEFEQPRDQLDSATDQAKSFDSLFSEEATTAASVDQLPDLFGEESLEAEPLTEPSDEFLSTLLSDSSDPIPAVDMPPPSAIDHPADTLDSRIDDLFASEPETELNYSEETEELLLEYPPEDNADLLQALINQAGSEASTGEVGSGAIADPWIEGTEDLVLGVPGDSIDPADPAEIEHSDSATASFSEEQPQPSTAELNQPVESPPAAAIDSPTADSSHDPAPDNPDNPNMSTFSNNQFGSLVDEDEFGTVEEIPPDFLLELQDEPADVSAAEPDRSESLFPSQLSSDPATGLEADEWQTAPQSSLEADLAALDLTTDVADEASAKTPRPEQASISPDLNAADPDLSQDALEAGLGDFREGFVEPLPSELLEDDNQLDWSAGLREPLSLDDEEGNYIIEDSPPDYTPPEYTPPEYTSSAAPLPDSPVTPAAPPINENQNPPWLFTAVLLGLCSLIAGLLGFSLFWSKLAPPPNSPPPTEPAPSSTPAPASPNSAKPAPANSARLATAQSQDRG